MTSKVADDVSSNVADGVSSKMAEGVTSKVVDGVSSNVAGGVTRKVTEGVSSKVVEGVTSKVAEGVSNKVADSVTSKLTEEVCSEVADRRGGAAEVACVVREMRSPSGIPADQTKNVAVTAVINDTGRETKEKTVEWTNEALCTAQEADNEIKPISEWKEAFQEPTEDDEDEMRRPLKERGDEQQHIEGGEHATTNEARGGGGSEEKPGSQEATKNSTTGEHFLGPRDDPARPTRSRQAPHQLRDYVRAVHAAIIERSPIMLENEEEDSKLTREPG